MALLLDSVRSGLFARCSSLWFAMLTFDHDINSLHFCVSLAVWRFGHVHYLDRDSEYCMVLNDIGIKSTVFLSCNESWTMNECVTLFGSRFA